MEALVPSACSRALEITNGRLSFGCVENALDRFIKHGIEIGVGLLSAQPFNQRAGEARDHAMLFAQTIVCLVPGISAGERDHPDDARMFDTVRIKVVLF